MSTDLDILSKVSSIDMSTVETSYPLLKSGVAAFTITKIEQVIPDDHEKKPYIHVSYALAQPWATQPHDGAPEKPVNIGFPMSERIYVNDWTDPKTGEVKNFGVTRLAQLREATLGKAAPGTRFNPTDLINQQVMLRLRFDPAPVDRKTNEVFGPRTEIAGYVRKAR